MYEMVIHSSYLVDILICGLVVTSGAVICNAAEFLHSSSERLIIENSASLKLHLSR